MSNVQDLGFFDPEASYQAARRRLREFERQDALVVRRQIAELLDILDQRIQRALQGANAVCVPTDHHSQCGVMRSTGDAGEVPFEVGELGNDEAAHGVDPDLERIEAVLNFRKAILFGLGHELPPTSDDERGTEQTDPAHRLSGDVK